MTSPPEAIARALGGAERAGGGWLARCPSHDNVRTPALSLGLGRDGRLLWKCHAGCSQEAVRAGLERRGLLAGGAADRAEDPAAADRRAALEARRRAGRQRHAIGIFKAAGPAEGTATAVYLREARGIPLRSIPTTVRHAGSVPHPSGGGLRLPAMVALVHGPHGRAAGVHRTYLQPDGSGKAAVRPDKAALGPIAGGAVRLARIGPVLVVGEGIESTLSFAAVVGLPAWAALSTSGMRGLVLPELPAAGELVVAADNDAAGLAAAEELAARAAGEGRRVRIAAPPREGMDFNDLLRDGLEEATA